MSVVLPRTLKKCVLKAWIALGLYPHVFFVRSPFKIFEFREVIRAASLLPEDAVLDMGHGSGLHSLLLARRCGNVVAADILPPSESVLFAHSRLSEKVECTFRIGKVEEAGFAPDRFDHVLGISALQCMANHERILAEAYRTLRPGGLLTLTVDTLIPIHDTSLLEKHAEDHLVYRYYRPDSLTEFLRAAGFRDIEVRPLLTSNFALRLFVKSIAYKFRTPLPRGVFDYYRLLWHETHRAGATEGLFLMAKCRK